MSKYGFNFDNVSRLYGGSDRVLAYILREKLYYEHDGKTYNFTHYTDLLDYGVLFPENAPLAYYDPFVLVNDMEKAENRWDSRTGHIVWLSLQNEFTPDEWRESVEKLVNKAFVSQGRCAIWAIHGDEHSDDPTKNNPNAHILLSDRPVDGNGFCVKKNRDWNKNRVRIWRSQWADIQNRIFERKNLRDRIISHESLEVQGIDRTPTVPLGRAAIEMELRGILTENGNKNRVSESERKRMELECQQKRERNRSCGRGR